MLKFLAHRFEIIFLKIIFNLYSLIISDSINYSFFRRRLFFIQIILSYNNTLVFAMIFLPFLALSGDVGESAFA